MEFLLPYMKNRKKRSTLTMPTENMTINSPSSDPQLSNDENSSQCSHENQNIVEHDSSSNTNEPKKRKSDKIDTDFVDIMRVIDESYNRRFEERERRIIESQKATEKHPLDSFFESMCATTKQFPTWLQTSVKRKIFAVVSEAEDTFENSCRHNTNTATHSTPSTSKCETESMSSIQDNQYIQPKREQKSPQ